MRVSLVGRRLGAWGSPCIEVGEGEIPKEARRMAALMNWDSR